MNIISYPKGFRYAFRNADCCRYGPQGGRAVGRPVVPLATELADPSVADAVVAEIDAPGGVASACYENLADAGAGLRVIDFTISRVDATRHPTIYKLSNSY